LATLPSSESWLPVGLVDDDGRTDGRRNDGTKRRRRNWWDIPDEATRKAAAELVGQPVVVTGEISLERQGTAGGRKPW
jgi:hypothetical protein